MSSDFSVHRASAEDAQDISVMAGELLAEISRAIGTQAFHFDHRATVARLEQWLSRDIYFAFIARDAEGRPAGFVTLHESRALYAEGAFGTIPEFYVRPDYRCRGIGERLASHVKDFARSRDWPRLEVTTPPLPQFERALRFYEREGFSITGGRKLKLPL